MDQGAGQMPSAGAPGHGGTGNGAGPGEEKPPPIPTAPDGPGRSYGGRYAPGHGPQGGSAGQGAPGGYGGGPAGPPGYPGYAGHPGAGATGWTGGYDGYAGHGGYAGQGGPAGYGGQSGHDGYGAGAYAPYGYGWQGPPPPAGKSVAAMVVGIASVVLVITCWGSFLAVFSSVVALVLGVSARRGVDRGELGGGGQATAGFILGIVGLVLSVVISTLLILGLTVWSDDSGSGSGGGGSGDSYDARGARAPAALAL
ncbi:DUF4190 domain-containing protein [Streptomyces sp. A73]|uniref:DUF4190 domain-containing protein n=1 Tax=Streptomyces TaxID=1883 RepID=UPI001B366CE2|nr:DUF4190 domain-containing protein [Streptomyces sp. RK75]MBQ0865417.1 DUF4190 domain-containing protein [Streptomyces sp. RK75]MBQ1162568.1 DUF4190 domain-containing protein [Streptomyces sp. A73]